MMIEQCLRLSVIFTKINIIIWEQVDVNVENFVHISRKTNCARANSVIRCCVFLQCALLGSYFALAKLFVVRQLFNCFLVKFKYNILFINYEMSSL